MLTDKLRTTKAGEMVKNGANFEAKRGILAGGLCHKMTLFFFMSFVNSLGNQSTIGGNMIVKRRKTKQSKQNNIVYSRIKERLKQNICPVTPRLEKQKKGGGRKKE